MNDPEEFVPVVIPVTALRFEDSLAPIIKWLNSKGFADFYLQGYLSDRSIVPPKLGYGTNLYGDFGIITEESGLFYLTHGHWLVCRLGSWVRMSDSDFHEAYRREITPPLPIDSVRASLGYPPYQPERKEVL